MKADRNKLFRSADRTGTPIIGMVADSGQVSRVGVAAGVDFLLALSAGSYRQHGFAAPAAFLPFRNSNDVTERLLAEHVLPHAQAVPIIAGLLASDPTVPLNDRLERW